MDRVDYVSQITEIKCDRSKSKYLHTNFTLVLAIRFVFCAKKDLQNFGDDLAVVHCNNSSNYIPSVVLIVGCVTIIGQLQHERCV